MTGRRIWFLLRRFEADSILFPIIVETAEDEAALFGASISGLDDRLAAMGRTVEEAERNAVEMFKDIVDLAIEKNTPLGHELGQGVPFTRLNYSFENAQAFFDELKATLRFGSEDEEWRLVPTTALVASSSVPV